MWRPKKKKPLNLKNSNKNVITVSGTASFRKGKINDPPYMHVPSFESPEMGFSHPKSIPVGDFNHLLRSAVRPLFFPGPG